MDNKKLLGKRIKGFRKSKNITQEKLAEMIGIETGSLSAIESGRHFPSLVTLEKIAKVLNTEISLLFEFGHLKPVALMKADIRRDLDCLSDVHVGFVYKFVNCFKNCD